MSSSRTPENFRDILFFYSKKKDAKNAATAEKIAKNQCIPLKENNSLRSNRFSFLTFHVLILFTHFFKGGSPSFRQYPITINPSWL